DFVELPYFHAVWYEVRVAGEIVLSESLPASSGVVAEHEEDSPVFDRREREVIHRLVPDRELSTRGVAARCPSMTLAFHQHRRIVAPEVERVPLLPLPDADWDSKSRMNLDASRFQREHGQRLEVDAHVGVRDRADPLKVGHRSVRVGVVHGAVERIGVFLGFFYTNGHPLGWPSSLVELCATNNLPKVARDGIEPPTRGFSVRCSTN